MFPEYRTSNNPSNKPPVREPLPTKMSARRNIRSIRLTGDEFVIHCDGVVRYAAVLTHAQEIGEVLSRMRGCDATIFQPILRVKYETVIAQDPKE